MTEDDIVPLCGPTYHTEGCHRRYDRGRLDLWPLLTDAERQQAVRNMGTVDRAKRRISGFALGAA